MDINQMYVLGIIQNNVNSDYGTDANDALGLQPNQENLPESVHPVQNEGLGQNILNWWQGLSPFKKFLVVGSVALGGCTLAKAIQAAFDEEFEGRYFPPDVRMEMIEDADYSCEMCGEEYSDSDLAADHIISVHNGGITSRANGQILCRWCNSSKGASNTFFDRIRGRRR